MAQFNARKLVASAAMVIFTTFFAGRSLVSSEKIDAKIDIVVVLQGDSRVSEFWLERPYQQLPTYFELGADKARLAVVACGIHMGSTENGTHETIFNDSWILMNFSADSALFEKAVQDFVPPTRGSIWQRFWFSYQYWQAMDFIRAQMFIDAGTSGRAKAVILIMTSYGWWPPENNEEVVLFRSTGVWVYIVSILTHEDVALEITADGNRTFIIGVNGSDLPHLPQYEFEDSLVGAMDDVVKAIRRDLCRPWNSGCRYVDKQWKQCRFESWLNHSYMNNMTQCDDYKPATTSATCGSTDDCKKECDKRWPWKKVPDCSGKCGEQGQRQGPVPPNMESCPKSMACPPCKVVNGAGGRRTGSIDWDSLYVAISVTVPIVLLIFVAAVVVLVMKRPPEKTPTVITSAKTSVTSVKSAAEVSAGKEALVGGGRSQAAETSIAADLLGTSGIMQGSKSAVGGKDSVKASPGKSDAGKSTKSVAKQAAGKSVVSKAKE